MGVDEGVSQAQSCDCYKANGEPPPQRCARVPKYLPEVRHLKLPQNREVEWQGSGSCLNILQHESGTSLNIPKLFLSHAEIVPQFVYERLPDLLADFCLARTDGFDVLLVKHDMGWTCR